VIARLPVPRPRPEAVAAGRFGYDDDQRPIHPGPAEARAITENHADKLIELLKSLPPSPDPPAASNPLAREFEAGIAAYTEDFGTDAAERLEAYVRRQSMLDEGKEVRHR
jgi:hypothetical protein